MCVGAGPSSQALREQSGPLAAQRRTAGATPRPSPGGRLPCFKAPARQTSAEKLSSPVHIVLTLPAPDSSCTDTCQSNNLLLGDSHTVR